MNDLKFYLDLDRHWKFAYEKWYINSNKKYFENLNIIDENIKKSFNADFLLKAKKIFNKEDINEIKKVRITKDNIDEYLVNLKNNFTLSDIIINNNH